MENSHFRAPVLSGLAGWEENLDEIDDEGDMEGDMEEEMEEGAVEEEDNSPVSFEEAREQLDAMSDWVSFMSRKFTSQEADMVYRRLNKLNKFFRPPVQEQVTIHAQSTASTTAAATTTTSNASTNDAKEAATTETTADTTNSNPATTDTTNTSTAADATANAPAGDASTGVTAADAATADWFSKWPCVSGLVRDGTPLLPLRAQNLITEYDARLWFPASADVVKVCPGWVAINVDRCIWGCLDRGWLDHCLLQRGDKGGIDDYTWAKFLRMHRAWEVFPASATDQLFQDFQNMMQGGPGFACDCCPGYKDATRRCKQCGMEKCEVCSEDGSAPLHFRHCEHFDAQEEQKREALREAQRGAAEAREEAAKPQETTAEANAEQTEA